MEYRTISTKLPSNELTLFKAFCEKKGLSPAKMIRKLILKELKIRVPHIIAGKNKIEYDKKLDSFIWSVELDDGDLVKVLKNISPTFIKNLHEIINIGLGERNSFIHKTKGDSVAIPSEIIRWKK